MKRPCHGGGCPIPFAFCAKGWAAQTSIFNPKDWTYRSEVPTLAKNARVGPQLW